MINCANFKPLSRSQPLASGATALGLAFLLAVSGCSSVNPTAESKPPPVQMARQLTIRKSETVKMEYLLFLPQGYERKSEKRWPMILFLHGAGERGSDVWKVATHGPPKIVGQRPDFPFIVVSPQCPDGEIWSNSNLMGLLDEIERKYNVDTNRVYLTGLSMGGYGTWSFGLAHPERFAAIVPICGGGEMISVHLSSREKTAAMKSLGIWAFHGGKDPVVPVEESQRMVDACKRVGMKDVQLTIYPEAGHNSWTEAYNDPKLYEWLLQHHR